MWRQPFSLCDAFLKFVHHFDWGGWLAWRKAASQCPRDGGGFGRGQPQVPSKSHVKEFTNAMTLLRCVRSMGYLDAEKDCCSCRPWQRTHSLTSASDSPALQNWFAPRLAGEARRACGILTSKTATHKCIGAGCHWPFEEPIRRREPNFSCLCSTVLFRGALDAVAGWRPCILGRRSDCRWPCRRRAFDAKRDIAWLGRGTYRTWDWRLVP